MASSLPVDFSKLFAKADANTITTLQRITAGRNSFIQHLSEDNSTALICAEDYLPYLFGLIEAASNLPPNVVIADLKISWTSSLGIKYSVKHYTSDHWHFEAVNALLAYGILQRNKASILLSQISANTAAFDQESPNVLKYLCTAAGIFDYIREIELARWTLKPDDLIPEKHTETLTFLSALCLAEAEQVAVKKAVLNQKLRFSAVAKISKNVANQFKFMNEILKSLPQNIQKSYIPQIWFYISMNEALYDLFSYKLLAISALQNHEYGKCLGYLSAALQRSQSYSFPVDKSNDAARLRQHFKAMVDDLQAYYSSVSKENNSIYYERVLPLSELQLPTGQTFAKPVPFTPPASIPITITMVEGSRCSIM